ncbi:hypothetical protein K440DRAFT_147061 [Wilcoxina mikolae CBS 423.85]|nr:hypothetical protein K440DRAFT_147061 [Wilcoxina mikolae CBS 423.85]
MTTPHRGLPPPAAMTLSSPSQGSSSGLGQLPQPWQGSEESLRTWLLTKMEEERRRAEEERTQQERLKVETRRVELEMLRESFKYGIPPPLVPLMFMGSGTVKASSGEWVHEYVSQYMAILQQAQHQGSAQHSIPGVPLPASPAHGPTLRRETRSIHQMHQQPVVTVAAQPTPPPHHPQQPQQMGPPTGGGSGGVGSGSNVQVGPPAHYVSTYQLPNTGSLSRPGPQGQPPLQQALTSSQPAPPRSGLPRISTGGELQIQQIHPNVPVHMPMGPPATGPASGPQHQTPHQQETTPVTQSPSIFFHHWVPPGSQSGAGGSSVQATASPQRHLDSPFTHNPPPNALSGAEYASSPKKRKMTTTQPQPPPPSTQPFSPTQSVSSPAVSTPSRTRRGHSRNRSDTNTTVRGFEPYTRPTTRQRRSLGAREASSIGEAISHGGQQPPYQQSAGDSGGSAGHSGSGTPSHSTPQEQHQQRQQSAPPSQHPQPPSRPYSAGSDLRRQPRS